MLKDLITSDVRVKILILFLSNPKDGLHVREITRRVGTEINAVRRELERFLKAGILKRESLGNRVYYRFRSDYPFESDLLSTFDKEYGLSSKILDNAKDLGKIVFGLLSLDFLRGREVSQGNIDLLIVGAVDLKFLRGIIEKYQEKIGREINYSVMAEDEFEFRKKRMDSFIIKVLSQSRVIFVGNEDKYCKIEN